jgi:hypothetical protein
MLGLQLYAPRESFYSPKEPKEPFDFHLKGPGCLLSAGAPDCPVHTRHSIILDLIPYSAKPTVASHWSIGTPDSPLAYRTVRCSLVTVVELTWTSADHAVDCWLRRMASTPDSLMIHSRDASAKTPERPIRWLVA